MGEIHKAYDWHHDRAFAVKEIHPDKAEDPVFRRRFLNEAAITAQLTHPGVVPFYALGQDDRGRPCYLMRFVGDKAAGERTLEEAIIDFYHKPLNPSRYPEFQGLLNRIITVCRTIHFAHCTKNIIHRDLTPDNILVGRYGETLVTDWGLAKKLSPRNSPTHSPPDNWDVDRSPAQEPAGHAALGLRPAGLTLAEESGGKDLYMAPEQVWSLRDAGKTADVYSIGSMLFFLLAGRPPYFEEFDKELGDARSVVLQKGTPLPYPEEELNQKLGTAHRAILARKRRFEDPQWPRAIHKEIPPDLDAVCRRAMASNPEARYQSAEELATDMERWIAGEPVTVYRYPWWWHARRWLKAHPAKSATLLATMIFAVIFAMAYGRARREINLQRYFAEQSAAYSRAVEYEMQGISSLEKKMFDEAVSPLEKAVRGYEKLTQTASSSGEIGLCSRLALAHYKLARAYAGCQRFPEASEAIARAIAYQNETITKALDTPHYRDLLGIMYVNRANDWVLCLWLFRRGRLSSPELAQYSKHDYVKNIEDDLERSKNFHDPTLEKLIKEFQAWLNAEKSR
jgi:serine/threonine protein kinase